MTTAREKLMNLILEKSYREGDFTLSSGQKSTFYIDLKPTILHPEGAKALGDLTVEWMKKEKLHFDGVGGLTLGADPIVMAVSLSALSQGMILPASMIRKEAKKHGTSRFIEGVENFKKGATFLVVEDVVTTGASAKKAIEILWQEGFKPTHVLTIVDREAGGGAEFRQAGLAYHALFTIQDIKAEYAKPKNSGAV
jgi:orotate phosphoribosyltransferase